MDRISFDQAADFYDRTRGHPHKVAEEITRSLVSLLGPGARVLEVGIGTGRISGRLPEHGLKVVGVDLSPRMMQRLRQNLPPEATPPGLVQGDITALPLAPASFDAVLAVHILHLVARWQDALAEARRVMRPGGSLLFGYDWSPDDSPLKQLNKQWGLFLEARGFRTQHPGPQEFGQIVEHLEGVGARLDEWTAAEWQASLHVGRHIAALENRIFSSNWRAPDEVIVPAAADLRGWAQQAFGSLDREIGFGRKFIWQRFRWEAAG